LRQFARASAIEGDIPWAAIGESRSGDGAGSVLGGSQELTDLTAMMLLQGITSRRQNLAGAELDLVGGSRSLSLEPAVDRRRGNLSATGIELASLRILHAPSSNCGGTFSSGQRGGGGQEPERRFLENRLKELKK